MRILVLDDEESRHRRYMQRLAGLDVVHAWTCAEAEKALEGPRFERMYLDHDLGSAQKNGADFCEYLVAQPKEKWPDYIVIHSWNYDGARRMGTIINKAGIRGMLAKFDADEVGL